jgi:hypothetical protein
MEIHTASPFDVDIAIANSKNVWIARSWTNSSRTDLKREIKHHIQSSVTHNSIFNKKKFLQQWREYVIVQICKQSDECGNYWVMLQL